MANAEEQKLTNVYNEFIRDYVEAHGQNQATRDEAHERAAWCVELGQSVTNMFIKFKLDASATDDVIDSITSRDEAYLVSCAVAVALEEKK